MRVRLLLRFSILLGIALIASIVVARAVLLSRMDSRIDARLTKEIEELHLFANHTDEATGRPFGDDIERLFAALLPIDPPGASESDLAFVDGVPYLETPESPPYRLAADPALVARWGALEQPETGRVDTPAGPVQFRAEPLLGTDGSRGVYVVAVFRDLEERDVEQGLRAAAGVGLAALIVGSVLAWAIAGRVLRPVEILTRTALSISESDLSRRIPLRGNDEISRLAATFNDMLDRLQTAFDTQRAFLDDAGHELRTPITVITGQLELLEDDPEERRRTIEIVMDELDRMARIVNDLLLLAKARHTDLLRLDTVDVASLTNDVFAKAESLGDRPWTLEAVGRGLIVADRQRLTQALMQLAANAVKHTNEGGLFLGSMVRDGVAHFWVSDRGPGIAPEDQVRIFDRFSKAGLHRREGAGLGLSIVQVIAEAHHGTVRLRSAPGEGATFTITIPVDQPVPPLEEELEPG